MDARALSSQRRAAALALLGLVLAAAPLTQAAATAAASAPAPRPLDINSAPAERLATLPGIGIAEARRIVAQRPYLSKADLVTRQVLPEGLYVQIRDRIVAVQKTGRPAAAARRASSP
ncbi:MAG: helix-hairpin-helix domain-containing protein [Rubrivivax sp.]